MQAHWRQWLALSACVLAVLAACFVIAAPQAGGGSPGTPVQLTVNLVSGPMAVPAGQGIRFSWVTSDARQGESQRGYELRVAASPAGLGSARGALWDTGTVTGGTPGATYAGRALRDGTRYWWTVRTLDAQGWPDRLGRRHAAAGGCPPRRRRPAGGRGRGACRGHGRLRLAPGRHRLLTWPSPGRHPGQLSCHRA
jgi:hypothetical protein